ncbi:MAG: glycosyltransferase [Rhizobiales bacterium]|nr:glycosyltransferase [Hyphomicrobiales bacterium]NRB14464.1 glycosyltransferase [Hyphomicrobiales bacterium]
MSELSIVIITLNEEFTISNILNDLKAQTVADFEVIIVDSASDDDTVNIATKFTNDFKHFQIIENKLRGASLGRNTGAVAAKYERLLFLDADTSLRPNFIETALNIVDGQNIDVAGIYMDMKTGRFANRATAAIVNLGLWFTKWIFPTIVGACVISTKNAHTLVGGFNEQIKIGEDCEYAVKMTKQKSLTFKMIPLTFIFDMRRFEQEGYAKILFTWGIANIRRFFFGEITKDQIKYQFGHHAKPQNNKTKNSS